MVLRRIKLSENAMIKLIQAGVTVTAYAVVGYGGLKFGNWYYTNIIDPMSEEERQEERALRNALRAALVKRMDARRTEESNAEKKRSE